MNDASMSCRVERRPNGTRVIYACHVTPGRLSGVGRREGQTAFVYDSEAGVQARIYGRWVLAVEIRVGDSDVPVEQEIGAVIDLLDDAARKATDLPATVVVFERLPGMIYGFVALTTDVDNYVDDMQSLPAFTNV